MRTFGKLVFLGVLGGVLVAPADDVPSVVAFGSCAKESAKQPIWEAVVAKDPGLFLFLGDNIYGDTDDMDVMRAKYAKLGAIAGYQKVKARCRVLATWDDHDFGRNDAGAEYEHKVGSQKELLRFFEEPEDSPRWKREGVYGDWMFDGGEGRRLQVILLDTRYFRSRMVRVDKEKEKENYGPYTRNEAVGATVLGGAQWAWLEEVLKKPADLRLVGTSIQAVPDGHGWEKWGNFPAERERLFGLVKKTRANGVVLLSGDRHLGEISVLAAEAGVGYPLYEVTSSGLTQAGGGRYEEPNEWRVNEIYRSRNFGTVRVDWDRGRVKLELWDVGGGLVNGVETSLDALRSGG
ncbi:MAG: alkaline phosphatase D family protein [Verrucomicrobiales bacterium]|nr:alkaline phosphatase D family protein [Verrucomicrobiales bacterium]